jgi:EAL domain-containing protein (putative c-di-GMP-specific phosphodiesterase class I)/CheY-like chemotaxis protein
MGKTIMNTSKQKILIVEDQMINREILKGILMPEYDVIESENGKQALEIIGKSKSDITAILLDIFMPVMDGYQFLQHIHNTDYSNLPIIVMTTESNPESEQRALDLGAWDFITKPYQPKILVSRLKNAIARSRLYLLDRMQYIAEHDVLTGLYNRTKFFQETKKMITEHTELSFVFIRLDVEHFSLLNFFWGEKEGDRFLQFISNEIRSIFGVQNYCTFGRINADIFCICEVYEKDLFDSQVEKTKHLLREYNSDFFIRPKFGVYIISNTDVPVEKMYEMSSLASRTCKNHYGLFVSYYDNELSSAMEQEQAIINEMQSALNNNEFVVYFQPKYNLLTNSPYGAEALVRWKHPKNGLIPPGIFIPIFERDGFIGVLDNYVWEKVCILLREWIDKGLNPAPVSVNISRVNMYNPNIVEILDNLVKKYRLPHKLLNLELTESAYMDNPEIMTDVVKGLQAKGFIVMMDDFGSGYSSLNTLKDISVDILKIDMKFLEKHSTNGKSEKILASMIRMAGWLDLPVIVEGIENQEERDFLASIGCGYVQGFYYARPMPEEEYENKYLGKEQLPIPVLSKKNIDIINSIWAMNTETELFFNAIQCPICIFEFDSYEFKVLRCNSSFLALFASEDKSIDESFQGPLTYDDISAMLNIFKDVSDGKSAKSLDFHSKISGKDKVIRMLLNYLAENENVKILFASFEDITEFKLSRSH